MIRPILTCKKLFLAVVLSFSVITLIAADRYSVATGDWNLNYIWSETPGGLPGASFPVAGDNVIIEGGFTVTTTANAACANYGIYIVSFVSGIYQDSKKIFIQNR